MRIVAHLDMDAFFSSIEERDNPRFRGRPVVVGSDPKNGSGRGVVSTANYRAREYGIRSAMPISFAWKCALSAKESGKKDVFFLGVDMKKYERVSKNIREIVVSSRLPIEQVSIDEFFIDCSSCGVLSRAKKEMIVLHNKIRRKELLSCSIGIGPNKFVAKIASDFKKPGGITVVEECAVQKFLSPLDISKIPGVGPKSSKRLYAEGVCFIGDLYKFSNEELGSMLGKYGFDLYKIIRGIEISNIEETNEVKSIGAQETFEKDTRDATFLVRILETLCTDVFNRFLLCGFSSFSRISVSVRFSDFTTVSQSKTLPLQLKKQKDLEFFSLQMILSIIHSQKKKVRLLGVRIEKLEKQISLL